MINMPTIATRSCFFALLFILFHAVVSAQTGTLKGTVNEQGGGPLAGATISIPTANLTHVSDGAGKFSFSLPSGRQVLLISYAGHNTERDTILIPDNDSLTLNIVLSASSTLAEVTVGSRSRLPRTITSTPVPVDVINVREIKNFPQTDVTQMLTFAAPSFQSSHQSVTDGTDHIDPASLRGLGPDQTLVLLNGKRRHNTALVNINGSVGRGSVGTHLNAIPAAAIERIEILRDGAAAQYGSDAIAGVINVVLKKKFKGFTASGFLGGNSTDMPTYTGKQHLQDGFTKQVDFSAGTYNEKGAYVNFSGQWLQRDQTNRSGTDNGTLMYYGTSASGFPVPTAANGGLPQGLTLTNAWVTQYRQWLMTEDDARATARGYNRRNMIVGQSSSNNFSGFLNAGIPINSHFQAYLTGGLGHRTGQSEGNARNPSSLAQQPQIDKFQSYYPDGFLPQIYTVINDRSLLGGVRGKYASWDIDLSNVYGENELHFYVQNSGNASLTPSPNPQTSFDAGVQKFSQNTVNLDLSRPFSFAKNNELNVAFGAEYRYETFGLVAGELTSWNTGSNTLNYATVPAAPAFPGYEAYGAGKAYVVTAPTAPGAQVFPGLQPGNALQKFRTIYSGYADLEYTRGKLLLGAAGRYESYQEKSAGVTYNGTGGKFTARYEINHAISVRGSVGTGFRAPSLHQRFYNSTSTQFVNGSPANTLTANNVDPIVRDVFGIKELKPETSIDYTLGVVATPGWGLTITVDGYFISIKDRIVLSAQYRRNGDPSKPNRVDAILNAYGIPLSTSSLQFWTNAINTETRGLDIVINKHYKLGPGSGNITLAANFNKNVVVGSLHTNSAIEAPENNQSLTDATKDPANDFRNILFDRQQRARIENGSPQSKVNFTVNYSLHKFDLVVRAVRFGKVNQLSNVDPTAVKPDGTYWNDVSFGADQVFSAKITTDIILTYKITPAVSVSTGANNVFDVYSDLLYIDPRNNRSAVYANPIVGANKSAGGYASGRDQTNRGRFLFNPNQFGYNGRFIFGRVNVDIARLFKK